MDGEHEGARPLSLFIKPRLFLPPLNPIGRDIREGSTVVAYPLEIRLPRHHRCQWARRFSVGLAGAIPAIDRCLRPAG